MSARQLKSIANHVSEGNDGAASFTSVLKIDRQSVNTLHVDGEKVWWRMFLAACSVLEEKFCHYLAHVESGIQCLITSLCLCKR
eukprot:5005324-Amphidinium_carterae.1